SPDAAEMAWERDGLALACSAANVAVADLFPPFTAPFQDFFLLPGRGVSGGCGTGRHSPRSPCADAVAPAQFAPYTSSILVDDAEFTLLPEQQVRTTLQRYGVPCDQDLVVAFGRATPLKGFETLIAALSAVRERCHFVLISVP